MKESLQCNVRRIDSMIFQLQCESSLLLFWSFSIDWCMIRSFIEPWETDYEKTRHNVFNFPNFFKNFSTPTWGTSSFLLFLIFRYTSVSEYLEITLRGTLFRIVEHEFERQMGKKESEDNEWLEELAALLLKQIVSSALYCLMMIKISESTLETMPFGLRIFMKQAYRLAQGLELSEKEIVNLIRDLVFESLYLRCILHPDIYLGVRGVTIRIELLSKVKISHDEAYLHLLSKIDP